MQVHRHIDAGLHAKQHGEARRRETAEGILVFLRIEQGPHDDKGQKRDDADAHENAELLAGHREDEVRVAVGKDALQRALARPLSEPAARDEGIARGIDLERIAHTHVFGLRLQKMQDARAHVWHKLIGDNDAGAADSADARDP